jgi:FkbM family methyltransferase
VTVPVATIEDIRFAYRLLLGREPDQAGFDHAVAYLENCEITTTNLADSIMLSAEFRSRIDQVSELQEIEFLDVKIYPWRGDRLIGDHLAVAGSYEPHVLPHFLDSISAGDFVLDVGANIGIYSLLAAKKVGASGKVFSIEPVAKNVRSLCTGIIENDLSNVTVLPVAASDRSSVIAILRTPDSSNGIVDPSTMRSIGSDFVPTQRLDVLLSGIERLNVIKIDIEGHEPIAWIGLESLVCKHGPTIFSEFSPVAIRNLSRTAPENYLKSLFRHAIGGIDVLHLDGNCVNCVSPAEIVNEWRLANERQSLDGSLHVDLRLQTGQ